RLPDAVRPGHRAGNLCAHRPDRSVGGTGISGATAWPMAGWRGVSGDVSVHLWRGGTSLDRDYPGFPGRPALRNAPADDLASGLWSAQRPVAINVSSTHRHGKPPGGVPPSAGGRPPPVE